MKWDIGENKPAIAGRGWLVLFNNVSVNHVCAFDTEEGWLVARCLDGHTGRAGRLHMSETVDGEACTVTLHGRVTAVSPEGIES
jgi:hypothetical protein